MDRISEPGQESSADISGEIGEHSLQVPLPTPEDPEYWFADSNEVPVESADPEVSTEIVDRNGAGWFKRGLAGAAIAFAAVLLGLLLLHIGIATEGGRAVPGLLSPSEFWITVQGLLVTWFPIAWLLTGVALALSAVGYLVGRETRPVSRPQLAGALWSLAALLMAGVAYQQFMLQVTYSLREAEIGVVVSRQLQSTDPRDQLSKYLAQMGQEGKVFVRALPVALNARDPDKARKLASRIDADAVVIYREQDPEAERPSAPVPMQSPKKQFGAVITFKNPGAGSEVAVPHRSTTGNAGAVHFRVKAGPHAPSVQTSSLARLMEATAGVVMYDQDRYLPAIHHLRNAVSPDRSDRSDGLILYYLGSAQLLAGEEEQAGKSLDEAISVFDRRSTLTVEEHLLLAHTYSARASVHLHANELDQTDALLKKAAALREPIDNDRFALYQRSDLRRFHETFGAVYLQLMDLASRREDSGAEETWRSRARGEANALLKQKGDGLARSAGIWLLYRTGGCEHAYQLLIDDLAEDPDDLGARRAISHLAALRSGFGSLESEQQIEELLKRSPHTLKDHQTRLLSSALKAAEDGAFIEEERRTLNRLLELDPVHLPALEELVTATEAYSRLYLNPSSAGHAPTFRTLQRGLLGDPQHASDVVDYIENARSQLKRWAELQPDSAAPFVAQLRLSFATESLLYNHIHVVPVSDPSQQPDPTMIQLYDKAWRGAVEEGENLLASTKQKTNSDLIRTHVVLGEIWLHRYFATLTGDSAAADEAITRASTHMESAAQLGPQLGPFIDEVTLANRSYTSMFTVFATASPHYQSKGESSTVERMALLARQAVTGIQASSAQSLADTQKRSRELAPRTCKTGDFMRAGRELLRRGEYRPAIQVLSDYVGHYPQDPEGHRELGWAHFKNRTLDRARDSMEKYQALAPEDPQAAAKLGAVYLAEGRERQGAEQIDRSLKLMDKDPLGLRLQQLSLMSTDLLEVASEHERSHSAVAEAVSRIRRYIGALPPKARTLEGARFVQVLSAAGAAAAWAGETTSAQGLLSEGLEINADHVLLRSTLGFAKLEGGDPAGARVEYEKAVASGPRYLQDWAGRPLGSADLEQAKQLLKQELEASAAALDLLGGGADRVHAPAVELSAMLRSAAASV